MNFLSFVTIWVFSFVAIWVFEVCVSFFFFFLSSNYFSFIKLGHPATQCLHLLTTKARPSQCNTKVKAYLKLVFGCISSMFTLLIKKNSFYHYFLNSSLLSISSEKVHSLITEPRILQCFLIHLRLSLNIFLH